MKIFSLDLNDCPVAYFFGTKGEVLQHAKVMRESKTPYTIRQHTILGGMNAKVLAKILNDASNQPWSEVEVLQVYDGKRKARSNSSEGVNTGGVILTPGEQEEFEQALTEAAAKRRSQEETGETKPNCCSHCSHEKHAPNACPAESYNGYSCHCPGQ